MRAVQVENLTVELAGSGARIVDTVSLDLDDGQVMGVVGESGSGKSTLALALLNFVRRGARISGGRVVVGDTDVLELEGEALRRARRDLVSYVPQDPATALNPTLKLRTQLLESVAGDRAEALTHIRGILEAVGLPSDDAFLKRRPSQLSGGQQQRVAIAMAIAPEPKLVVLDEPTTGLDVSTQAMVLELVGRLCREREMAAIYISHDLAVVAEVADFVSVMYGGQLVEIGRSETVLREPAHPYTRALLNAVPSASERLRLRPIDGRAPAVGEHRGGCVFAPRCPFAIDACFTTDPELVAVPSGNLSRCIRTDEVLKHPLAKTSEAYERSVELTADDAVLAVDGLTAGYGGKQVLFDVTLGVSPHECLAIVGESGSGKTTMSRCLIGLHSEQGGVLTFEGSPLPPTAAKRSKRMRQRLQYVFQNPYGSLNPRHTIEHSMETAVRHFGIASGAGVRGRIREALDRVEIPWSMALQYPAELSGGQRQRVAIARALVCDPSVLICDEVTSALDVSVQASVVELLRSLLDDGLSMVFVTHNLAVVRSIADSVAVLSKGRVVEAGATEQVLSAPSDPYTQGLLADTLEIPA